MLYIFRATILHIQKFNTILSHKDFYLLINAPTCFGLNR